MFSRELPGSVSSTGVPAVNSNHMSPPCDYSGVVVYTRPVRCAGASLARARHAEGGATFSAYRLYWTDVFEGGDSQLLSVSAELGFGVGELHGQMLLLFLG